MVCCDCYREVSPLSREHTPSAPVRAVLARQGWKWIGRAVATVTIRCNVGHFYGVRVNLWMGKSINFRLVQAQSRLRKSKQVNINLPPTWKKESGLPFNSVDGYSQQQSKLWSSFLFTGRQARLVWGNWEASVIDMLERRKGVMWGF